jgi:hypothetical protein
MEGTGEMTKEEAIARAEAISLAEERTKWPLIEEVIRAYQEAVAALAPPLAEEHLPPPLPTANMWPPPHVFINLGDED